MLSDAEYWKLIAIWAIVITGFISLVLIVYLNSTRVRLPDTMKSRVFWIIEMISLLLVFILIIGAILSGCNII